MIALSGVAKENAERAAKRIEIAVQMVTGNLGPLIGSRGCGKSPVTGPTYFNIDDPEYQKDYQEEKKVNPSSDDDIYKRNEFLKLLEEEK